MITITKMARHCAWLALGGLLFTACGNDDDGPEPVNEEEEITTVVLTFTPATASGTGTPITFRWQDLDGDGGNAPVITNPALAANTGYALTVRFLNENENPAEEVTEEIEEEDDEHQVFFVVNPAALMTITYADSDDDNNPVGLINTALTGAAGTGTLRVVLKHQPDIKSATTTINDGETDIDVTFNLRVQ